MLHIDTYAGVGMLGPVEYIGPETQFEDMK